MLRGPSRWYRGGTAPVRFRLTVVDSISVARACAAIEGWLGGIGPGSAQRMRVAGLYGGAGALAVADLAGGVRRPLLVVAPSAEVAETLASDIRFFAGESDETPPAHRRVHYVPGWDVPVFDEVSPAREVTAARMMGLFHLIQTPKVVVVTTPEALLQRVLPRAEALKAWLYLVKGETQRQEDIVAYLAAWGYHRVPAVQDLGEYAVRGGILDVYPGGYAEPVRFEFSGDTIEDIRSFDPGTQRSGGSSEDALVLPVQEYALARLARPATVRAVEERAADLTLARKEQHRWVEALEVGLHLPGIDFLLPYFYERLDPLTAYLPPDTVCWIVDPRASSRRAGRFATRRSGARRRRRRADCRRRRRRRCISAPTRCSTRSGNDPWSRSRGSRARRTTTPCRACAWRASAITASPWRRRSGAASRASRRSPPGCAPGATRGSD